MPNELSDGNRVSVYLMRGYGRFLKIGISSNVDKRQKAIQTGNALAVEILRVWAVGNPRLLERRAHQILKNYRTKGEWFDIPVVIAVEAIRKALAASGRCAPHTIAVCKSCGHRGLAPISSKKQKLRCSSCKSISVSTMTINDMAETQRRGARKRRRMMFDSIKKNGELRYFQENIGAVR